MSIPSNGHVCYRMEQDSMPPTCSVVQHFCQMGHAGYCMSELLCLLTHGPGCRYLARQQAAVRLQAMWRGRQARLALRQMQAAALLLQAVYRGWRVRQTVAESHAFAMFLQSCCRAARQRTAFLRLRAAASVLQAAVRGQQQRNR